MFLSDGGTTQTSRSAARDNFTPSRRACGPTFHMYFRYRGSIAILDTRNGIVIVALI